MTIAKRLALLLTVPLVALLGLGVFTRLELSKIEERSSYISKIQISSLALLGNLSRNMMELRVHVRSHLLATNLAEQAAAQSAFTEAETQVNHLVAQYAESFVSDDR